MNEKDDFWNIDRILPKGRQQQQKNTPVDTVEISTSSTPRESGVDVRALFSSVNEKKNVNSVENSIVKERDYSHFSNSRVISYAYVGKYSNLMTYDNRIRTHALSMFYAKPSRNVEFAEYFSFNPSFAELSQSQLEWYLYWRENIRNGIFFKTSVSYVLLFVCEIINLPDKMPVSDGLKLLIKTWNECTDPHLRYDKLITDIILEYCMVHDLPIPYEQLGNIVSRLNNPMSNVLGSLYLFDYLLAEGREISIDELRFIFEKYLGYSYDSSKHYSTNDRLRSLLDTYFYRVLLAFIKAEPSCITQIFTKHESRTSAVKIIRPTFLLVNASPEVKKNIVFEYYSFERSDAELLYLHNIAKQIENRFRSECGIRARLTVSTISDSSKSILDSIFLKLFPKKAVHEQEEIPTPRKALEIDVSKAQSIEKRSWETTKMLIDGIEIFDDEAVCDECETNGDESCGINILTELEKEVVKCLIEGKLQEAAQKCEASGVFLDGVVISINEKLMEHFGDTVIDSQSSCVYDDYVEELTQLFI